MHIVVTTGNHLGACDCYRLLLGECHKSIPFGFLRRKVLIYLDFFNASTDGEDGI